MPPDRPAGTDELLSSVPLIAGRYRLLQRLGAGGMGTVFVAEQVALQRRCAIKLMKHPEAGDIDALQRFQREAANAARLAHPNVAAIFDFGEFDGQPYLAMELVTGPTLEQLASHGPQLPQRVAELVAQLARGLDAAHAAGIVHRDLKPANVVLTTDAAGREMVKIVDFGISRRMGSATQLITAPQFVIGTDGFIAPEQYRHAHDDALVDIYSLGVLAVYLLIGGMPAVERGMALDLSSIDAAKQWPPAFREAVARAIAADRTVRWPSAGAFANALSSAASPPARVDRTPESARQAAETMVLPSVEAPRPSPARALPTVPLFRRPITLVGIASVVSAAIFAFVAQRDDRDPTAADGKPTVVTPPNGVGTQASSAMVAWSSTSVRSSGGLTLEMRYPSTWAAKHAPQGRPPVRVGHGADSLVAWPGVLLLELPDSGGVFAVGADVLADPSLSADRFALEWARTTGDGQLRPGPVRPSGDGVYQAPLLRADAQSSRIGFLHLVMRPESNRVTVLWRAFLGSPEARAAEVRVVMDSLHVTDG